MPTKRNCLQLIPNAKEKSVFSSGVLLDTFTTLRVSSEIRLVGQHKVNSMAFCGIFVSFCSVWNLVFVLIFIFLFLCIFYF